MLDPSGGPVDACVSGGVLTVQDATSSFEVAIDLGGTAESLFNAQLQTDVSDDDGVPLFI